MDRLGRTGKHAPRASRYSLRGSVQLQCAVAAGMSSEP